MPYFRYFVSFSKTNHCRFALLVFPLDLVFIVQYVFSILSMRVNSLYQSASLDTLSLVLSSLVINAPSILQTSTRGCTYFEDSSTKNRHNIWVAIKKKAVSMETTKYDAGI